MEQRHITLNVEALPRDFGSGETEKRLRREAQLAETGNLIPNLSPEDPLRIYLEELAAIPAAGDPEALALRLLDGEDCGQLLANCCMSMAVEEALGFTGRGVLLLDLIQEASLGLWEGILHYKGGEFLPYIRWWIRQYAARTLVLQARQMGLGRKMRQGMEDFGNADKRLLTRLGRNPTLEELAAELGVTPEEAEVYGETLRSARAMEKVKQPPKEPEAEDDQAVEDTAYFQSRQRIQEMLSTLTEREARLLTLRFGLDGQPPRTPEQVGQLLELTTDQVLAMEAGALAALRKEGT